jgi:hypothetical protein
MKKFDRAASAASFTLLLILSLNCLDASAQEAVQAASIYQQPSSVSVAMTETPQAPSLQGASCGTTGPASAETIRILEALPVATKHGSGKSDASAMLRGFSDGIDQFKGKIAQKAFSFLNSLQNSQRKNQAPIVPNGYQLTRQSIAVSRAVF